MIRVRSIAALLGLVLVALVAFAPMAAAQTDGDSTYPLPTTPPTVLGNDFEKDPPATTVPPAVQAGATLPVTGGDFVGLAVLGLVAVGAGMALVRYQRRTDTGV